jgi:hypothetical protein
MEIESYPRECPTNAKWKDEIYRYFVEDSERKLISSND